MTTEIYCLFARMDRAESSSSKGDVEIALIMVWVERMLVMKTCEYYIDAGEGQSDGCL